MGANAARPICVDVLVAIARSEDTTVDELDLTLQDHFHTDALELLVGNGKDVWEISFQVPDHEVSVESDGATRVDGEDVLADR